MLEHALAPATYWERVATTRWGQYTTRIEEEALKAALQLIESPGAALEVGCEGGRWSRLLARAGWSLTCTDVNPAALEICQRRVPAATCLLVAPDANTIPCETASIDLLLCIEVFPVMESDWFLGEARRALVDRGVLIGVALNRSSLRGFFVRLKEWLGNAPHAHYRRSYAAWKREAEAAGFSLLYERGYCWFPLARNSNSILAPAFAFLEPLMGLSRLVNLSPWVVFVARKRP